MVQNNLTSPDPGFAQAEAALAAHGALESAWNCEFCGRPNPETFINCVHCEAFPPEAPEAA